MPATDFPPNIEEVIDGVSFPASRARLVSYAEDQGAGEEALGLIQALPDESYDSLSAVNRDLGKIEQLPGQENMWSARKAKFPKS